MKEWWEVLSKEAAARICLREQSAQTMRYQKNAFSREYHRSAVGTEMSDPEWKEATRDVLIAERKRVEQYIEELFRTASPEVVLLHGPKGITMPYLLQNLGTGRFMWSFALAASGSSTSESILHDYLSHCAAWFMCWQYEPPALDPLSESFELSAQERLAQLSKLTPVESRALWVSREISTAVISAFADLSPENSWLKGAVSEYWNLAAAISVHDNGAADFAKLSVDIQVAGNTNDLSRLVEMLSLQAGSRANTQFEKLIFEGEADRHPWVRFNKVALPLANREAMLSAEVAFLGVIDRLENTGVRGKAYERAVASICAKFLPDADVLEDGLYVGSLECDVVLDSPAARKRVIIECKSKRPGRPVSALTASVESDVIHGIEQVAKRIQAFSDSALTQNGTTLPLLPGGKMVGLVLPCHSYGGAIWSTKLLEALGAESEVEVIPLPQFIMVLRAMANSDEFHRYLLRRKGFWRFGYRTFDELEPLMAYLRKVRIPFSEPRDSLLLFENYALPSDVVYGSTVPKSAQDWKDLLMSQTREVSPPPIFPI